MTRKEFEKLRVEIEAQKFQSVQLDPISYGIQRLLFEKEKFKKLIVAAEAIPMKTTRAKAERWKRKLVRADTSLLRLQKVKEEMDSNPKPGMFLQTMRKTALRA
ncbi:MAG: hypothetical protein JWM68_5599 [Verrucomicrobiales bacterium]|nr:hypothetical protein [Verrucomicrobiales bacterium]